MSEDYVFLQANKVVDLSGECSFGKHLGGFLEGRRRDEAGTLNRSLRDTEQLSATSRGLGFGSFTRLATEGFDASIGFFDNDLRHDLTFDEITFAWISDTKALGSVCVDLLEVKTIADQTRKKIRIARSFDFHFTKHASNNDFNVLIIDFYTLASVNLLNLVSQIILNGFFTRDAKNVVWNQRAFDELLTSGQVIASLNQKTLSRRNHVFRFHLALFVGHDERTLTTFLVTKTHDAIDLSENRWILWLTSFKDLGHTRQTTSDVRNSGRFTRRFSQCCTCRNHLAFFNKDVGLLRQIVNVKRFAF